MIAEYIIKTDGEPDVMGSYPVTEKKELIRCRDCKFRFVDGDNVRFNICLLNHNRVQADGWFCADGERKQEE